MGAGLPTRAAVRLLSGVLSGVLAGSAVLLAAPAAAGPPEPDGSDAWFGPALDPPDDDLAVYAERLGVDPSLVAVEVDYPLDDSASAVVREVAADASTLGTVVVLDARPTVSLPDLGPGDATDLAQTLHRLERDRGARFLVRFAPEMNAPWETWGQQPHDYVAAFRTVASALHADTDAGVVWAPVDGSGYPFRAVGGADGALGAVRERDRASLDTTGDDRLDAADDPYGPYYPGDAAVDWVGLSKYRPDASATPGRGGFVDRFATSDRPALVSAAAPYDPAAGGVPDPDEERRWRQQLIAAVDADDRIGGAIWNPVRTRPDSGTARALRRDLRGADRIELAPVFEVRDRDTDLVTPQPAGPAPGADPTLDHRATSPAWWWLGCGVLLVLALVAGLLRPRWLDIDEDVVERDPRLDVVRGTVLLGSAVALVVTLGLGVGSLPGWLVVGGVGTLLVTSGAAHALTEHRLASADGGRAAVAGHLRRAALVYLAAVVLTLLHLLLDAAGGITSPFGTYADAALLLEYPPRGDVVADLLTLRIAPGPVGLLGLFASLAVVASAVGVLCHRGAGWAVLATSWLAFGLGLRTGWHVAPLGWEAGWPLLVWQVPFVHGLLAVDLLLVRPDRGRRLALLATGVAGLSAAGWGALVLVGLAPDAQPAMLVAMLGAATVLAVAVLGWGLVGRAFARTEVVGRHPVAVLALLLLAVVAASLV